MKTLNLLAAGMMIVGTVACSDDDSKSNSTGGNAVVVSNELKAGTWKITNFVEDN